MMKAVVYILSSMFIIVLATFSTVAKVYIAGSLGKKILSTDYNVLQAAIDPSKAKNNIYLFTKVSSKPASKTLRISFTNSFKRKSANMLVFGKNGRSVICNCKLTPLIPINSQAYPFLLH